MSQSVACKDAGRLDVAPDELTARYFPALTPWDALRWTLGLLLLLAATLKTHQLASEPFLTDDAFGSRWPLIALVEFEFFLGLWLIAGVFPKWSWWAAFCCFSVFGIVSLYKALSGATSCGCFGDVPVSPWHTLLLDSAAVGSLLYWRPKLYGQSVTGVLPNRAAGALAIAWLLVGLPAGAAMARFPAATAALLSSDELVVVDPSHWLRLPFPLENEIDGGKQLTQGVWLVLFYQHGCSACEDAVVKYRQLASDFAAREGCPHVAIIECPPYSLESSVTHDAAFCGRLSNSKQWKVPTPLAFLLEDGQVRHVFVNARDMDLIRGIWG